MGAGQVPGGGAGAAGAARPLQVAESIVAVGDTETLVAAANPLRRGLTIQNRGGDVVQVYMTTALGFGGGGTTLAPATSTTPGGIWQAQQIYGIIKGAVYAICGTGDSTTLSVTEET